MEKVRLHIKNNHAAPHTFPNTPEGEITFTITPERYAEVAKGYPELAKQLDIFIDWDEDHFAESIQTAEILICWDLPTAVVARSAPKLKWIHCIGAGVEHLLPLDWMPPGVQLTNNKGVHARKAGEYGLMTILMLHNSIPFFATSQRRKSYDSVYSTPVAGKTLLVIGVGSMGGSVAKLAKSLDMKVLGVSRHGKPCSGVDETYTVDELDRVLPRADFVFVSTPLTPETHNLVDRKRLQSMKPGSGLVNIGRAAVVDYDALRDCLTSGHLSGAVLDVFDPEPLPVESPLWDTPNLIITPHVSADDGNSYVPLTLQLFFENLELYLSRKPLKNRVRPDLGY